MSDAGARPPLHPIRNPNHPWRTGEARPCDVCGRTYRPWISLPESRFCSTKCAGVAHSKPDTSPPPTREEAIAILREMRTAYAAARARLRGLG